MSNERKLPISRTGRLARLAGVGARAGFEKLAGFLGKRGSEDSLAQAAADALGTMRGLALKLGQMASYVDGLVAQEHRELYQRTMRGLREAAATMSADAARQVVIGEFGRPPEELFSEWSPTPFASASIGQVHRARLQDGKQVAVKVQYEGIARAVAADLTNSELLGTFLGPLGAKLGLKDQLGEMRARFEEELDYLHEAASQRAFASLFSSDERIRVPAVIDRFTTRLVLTTELVFGRDFEEACSSTEAERRAWAETLWRFVFSSLLGPGFFNADPHPGNYIFGKRGIVWFLDFGCTRTLNPKTTEHVRRCHRSILARDEERFYRDAHELLGIPEGIEQARYMREYFRLCFEPMLASGPYKITHGYAAKLLDDLRARAKIQIIGSKKEFRPLPVELLFLNRLQLGFYSVLARLDVAVDYRALHGGILA